jgi:hypothetical protein
MLFADTLEYLTITPFLPSAQQPTDTSEKSFRNLKFPMDWKDI